MESIYRDYMMERLIALLDIDSVTGYYHPIEDYLVEEAQRLGYMPERLRKGGVLVSLGGVGNGLLLTAHADTIGFMVRYVNPDGSIRVSSVGGIHPFMCDQANVRVHTRCGSVYTGTLRRSNSCLHLMRAEDREATLDFEKNFFLYLDEEAKTAEDVQKLGIRCGDIVALDPNTLITPSGFIKSRFIDDKTCVAILLTLMKYIADASLQLHRHVSVYFSLYEEVGHGGASGIPADTVDILALDIGCCGPEFYADEKKVTIAAMDTAFPYHRDMMLSLVATAEAQGIEHAVDLIVPFYGSDADAALRTGLDVRHGLIGPGVLSTHGYERTHIKSLEGTFDLLSAYVRQP